MDARGLLLRAAVGFALVPPTEPELRVLHQWLDCWRGVGDERWTRRISVEAR
jgi:hypothetical protein